MLSLNPKDIPESVDYQWASKSVAGDERLGQLEKFYEKGWRLVPWTRHLDLAKKSQSPHCIEYGGLVLIERPKHLSDRAKKWEADKARSQLNNLRLTEVKRKTGIKEFFVLNFWKFKVWLQTKFNRRH